MNAIYEKNIRAWDEKTSFLKEKIEFLNTINLKEENAVRETDQGIEFFLNGEYYKINSRFPDEEAELLTKGLKEKKDYFIVLFTIGNLNLLHKIMKMISADSRLLIYEPNFYLFKYVLMHYDLSFLLDSGQVGLLFDYGRDKEMENEISSYASLQWGNLIKNLQIIAPPNTWHYREKCYHVVKQLCASINLHIKLLGNSLEDIFNGQENNYKNIDAEIETNDLREIKDKFQGYPAIIVASGPSLDKNIDILSEAQDKALIIACDASMEACKKYGVKPDGVASIERDIPTYQYYYEGKSFDERLVLLGPSLLWPQIYEEYKGKKIVTNKVDTGIDGWWCSHFSRLQFLNQGMSSAHVAFAYARYAGCDPIILIGQDLAYTENKKHSDLTHTEFEGENDSHEADDLMVEGINGEMLLTDRIYNIFRKWYEDQIAGYRELKVIDATEGGAKILGSEIMTLREAVDTYCVKSLPFHLYDCLSENKELDNKDYIHKYEELIREAKKQKNRLKRQQSRAAKHYRLLEDLYYGDSIHRMNTEQLTEVLLKMQKGDRIIQELSSEEYLFTYFQQMVRQTIIFVKGLGNEITPENVIQNIRLQANLMGVIKDSVVLILQEYDKMIDFLEEKKAERERREKA